MDLLFKDLIGIHIQEFHTWSRYPVDVFVHLSDEKYVQIAHAGEEIHIERLSQYEHKQVDVLYVRKSEYERFVNRHIEVAGVIVARDDYETHKKSKALEHVTKMVFNELDHLGFTSAAYHHAKSVSNATITLIEINPDLKQLLEAMKDVSDESLAHSIAVSVVAVSIANSMGWTHRPMLEKLALGAMLHDVGLKQIPKPITQKPLGQMSYEEVQIYETHPMRGMQMLQSLGVVPDDVLSIVYEHHENNAGHGYPRRLKKLRIHPLAQVVSLANVFCEMILKGINCPHPKKPAEAFLFIQHNLAPLYNKDALKGLAKLTESYFVDEYEDAS